MKILRIQNNLYLVIIIMTLLASLMQLNLLGTGILSRFTDAQEGHSAASVKPSVAPTSEAEAKGFTPQRIVIDKVHIDLPIVSVPLVNGTWAVQPHVANFAEGTSLVNQKTGNVGVFAHDRTDAFHNIKQVLTGYDIIVYGNNYRGFYKVQSATIVTPTAIDVFYPTKEPTLTLITCDGTFSDKRYMVKAKLVKIEKIK
jgi:LPXTG-site transpeptidase (sortase) family protein